MPKTIYHICNNGTKEIKDVVNLYKFLDIPSAVDSNECVFLINVHLNWQGRSLSNNYGFELANNLRTQKEIRTLAPIIFYSPIPVEYFEKKSEKEIKYKILFGRGSTFIEAPFKEAVLNKLAESIRPLNKASLHDVVTMLCDIKGIVIEKINHDLKFGEDVDKIVNTITPYLSEKQKELIGLNSFIAEIKKNRNEKDFNTTRQLFVEKCNYELTPEGGEKPKIKKSKYKILVVDDVAEDLANADKFLKDDFKVITAATGKKAIDILVADTHNEILAVISDWRLFTDEKKNYWQPLQGYEVLEIATKTGIRALFALTSQANFLIHQIRNLMGLHFPLFQKQNLTSEGQWKVMSDALLEACETTEEAIKSQPTSDQWKSRKRKNKDCGISLKEIYGIKRHAKDSFFTEINDRADETWKEYIGGKKIRYLLGELSTTTINEDVLKEVLIQRRIWIGLFLNYNNAEKIFELMTKDPRKIATKNDITQLKIKLCITESDIKQKRFLPEEISWFKKENLIE